MSMYGRTGAGGRLPANAFNGRNRIAQTMMNIGRPPPQVGGGPQGGLPPGTMMAPSPLKSLMGLEPGMSQGFMGGEPTPMPGYTAPPAAPAPTLGGSAGPMPPPPPPPQQPVDPSTLFAKPPTFGQPPPQFAKPPTF